MSFYWYLDITETTTPTGPPGTPVAQAADLGQFSIGPIKFLPEESITVYELITRFSDAFKEAYQNGAAPRLYQMKARVRAVTLLDAAEETGSSSDLMSVAIQRLGAARENKELAIEYRIENLDNVSFKILFRSGMHGSAGNIGSFPSGGPPLAEVTVDNTRKVEAQEVPYCILTTVINDRPPIPPDLLFIPYVGVNNKIMIMFNSNAGERLEKPIMLKPSDIGFVLDEYFAQHNITIDASALDSPDLQELQYRNDDPVREYELFRITTKPTSYKDFMGQSVSPNPLTAKLGPNKFSTGVSYVDTIVPNKKYWYCGRSSDIHNNISNPTHIFEVEMVDNRGQMYMKSRVVSFTPAQLSYKKRGSRYIAIRPRSEQRTYDSDSVSPEVVGIDQPPASNILGIPAVRDTSSVWGKNFKVRITSKQTGRKIDLNIGFKNTGVIIP